MTSVKEERLIRIQTQAGGSGDNCAKVDYKLIHENALAKEISGEFTFGRVEVTYSHNALISACDMLIAMKELPMFRELNLVPACLREQFSEAKKTTYESTQSDKERE